MYWLLHRFYLNKGQKAYKHLHFHGTTIKNANFRETHFTAKATEYFVNTKFEKASFDGAAFHSKILFNNSNVDRSRTTQDRLYNEIFLKLKDTIYDTKEMMCLLLEMEETNRIEIQEQTLALCNVLLNQRKIY